MTTWNSQNDSKQVKFSLNIGRQEYLQYYQGQVKWVLVDSYCGKKVKFPANMLTSHVSHNGVQGEFILHYLTTGKAIKLEKVR